MKYFAKKNICILDFVEVCGQPLVEVQEVVTKEYLYLESETRIIQVDNDYAKLNNSIFCIGNFYWLEVRYLEIEGIIIITTLILE